MSSGGRIAQFDPTLATPEAALARAMQRLFPHAGGLPALLQMVQAQGERAVVQVFGGVAQVLDQARAAGGVRDGTRGSVVKGGLPAPFLAELLDQVSRCPADGVKPAYWVQLILTAAAGSAPLAPRFAELLDWIDTPTLLVLETLFRRSEAGAARLAARAAPPAEGAAPPDLQEMPLFALLDAGQLSVAIGAAVDWPRLALPHIETAFAAIESFGAGFAGLGTRLVGAEICTIDNGYAQHKERRTYARADAVAIDLALSRRLLARIELEPQNFAFNAQRLFFGASFVQLTNLGLAFMDACCPDAPVGTPSRPS